VRIESDHPLAFPEDGDRSGSSGPDGTWSSVLPVGEITATVTDPDNPAVLRTATGTLPPAGTLLLPVELPAGVTTLTGVVANVSGDGIPGASVQLVGVVATVTDAAGFYRFDDVAPGSYTLAASFGSVTDSRPFAAGGGIAQESFTLAVPMLKGTVTESDGAAAAAQVRLCGPLAVGGIGCLETTTIPGGAYLLVGWPAWTVNGTLTPSARPLDDPNVQVVAPGFAHRPALGLTEQRALAFAPAGALTGRVDDAGSAVAGVQVAVYRDFSFLGSRSTDANGDYSFPRLSPGPVTVFAVDDGGIPGEASGEVVQGESRRIDVSLIETATLEISVEDAGGTLLAGEVTLQAFPPPRVSPFPSDWFRSLELVDAESGEPRAGLIRVPPGEIEAIDRGDWNADSEDGPVPAAAARIQVVAGDLRSLTLVRGSHLERIPILEGDVSSWGDCEDLPFECRRLLDLRGPAGFDSVVRPELDGRQFESLESQSGDLWSRRVTFVPASGEFARQLIVIENRGSEPADVSLGGDARLTPELDWEIAATASGDSVFDVGDAWMLARHPDDGDFAAVVLGDRISPDWVWFSPGVDFGESFEEASIQFGHELTVPAGATRALLAFHVELVGLPEAEVLALVQSLADLTHPDALLGLSPGERSAVANFAVPLPEVELTGRLLDGVGGVPGARVALVAADGRVRAEDVTGAGGAFHLVGFGPGDFELAGFDPATGLAGRTTLSVAVGEAPDVDLFLDGPQADLYVAGVPLDAGVTVPGQQVAARFPNYGGIADRYAWLDGSGLAELESVPAGRFELVVGRRPPALGWAEGTLAAAESRNVPVELGSAVRLPHFFGSPAGNWVVRSGEVASTPDGECAPLCASAASGDGEPFEGQPYARQLAGGETRVGPRTLSGLVVERRQLAHPAGEFLRLLEVIHNPTTAPIDVEYSLEQVLVEDGDALAVTADASGDAVPDVTDAWLVVGPDAGPQYAFVLSGAVAGAPHDAVAWSQQNGEHRLETRWSTLSLAPGETALLMQFVVVAGDPGAAASAAAALADLSHPDALSGLSAGERAAIRNFQVP
jgi:hypothetical protein